jgi:hypothetical protein
MELPSYLVIQGVGAWAQSPPHAMSRGFTLATSRGFKYVELNHQLSRKQGHERGKGQGKPLSHALRSPECVNGFETPG